MSAVKRITVEDILAASNILWTDESIANKVALESVKIINCTYKRKFSFFSGKSSRNIVGGLLYLLGFRYDLVVRQKEIAYLLSTSDVTIRASYRKWLETFPDLFLDVIGKLALDKDLRNYVLLDLKPFLIQSR